MLGVVSKVRKVVQTASYASVARRAGLLPAKEFWKPAMSKLIHLQRPIHTIRTSPLWQHNRCRWFFIVVVLVCLFWVGDLFFLQMDKMEEKAGIHFGT